MDVAIVILLVAAAVCFLIAFLNTVARYNLVALGLLFWVIVELISAADKLA